MPHSKTGAGLPHPYISPNRRRAHACDRYFYEERTHIERCFANIKQFRRVAACYDKVPINVLGLVTLAAIVVWLK